MIMNQYESTIINDNGGKTMSSTTHLGMVYTTYKNGDDWGMVQMALFYHVLPTVIIILKSFDTL